MKKIGIKTIAIAALSLVGISATFANTCEDRWYVSGTGALVFRNQNAFLEQNNSTQKKEGVEFKNKLGWGTSVAIGRTMGCWRAELEASYRRNKLKDFFEVANGQKATEPIKADAFNRDLALMANVYYDIPVCDCFSIYLGAGAGVSFNEIAVKQEFTDSKGNEVYGDHNFGSIKNTLFAWQVMSGIAYDLNENWTVTLGYRLFATTKPKTRATYNQVFTETVKASKIPLSHSIELGLRYKF